MAEPSSQVIASWVAEDAVDTEWALLREVCIRSLTTRWLGKSALELDDFVEEKLFYIAEELRTVSAECAMDGRIQFFEIDNEPQPYIRAIGRNLLNLLDKIRCLEPIKVEALCAEILSKLGGESYSTPPTRDGGIDFVATNVHLFPKEFSFPTFCRAVIIGQTKRYKKGYMISETQIREFVGAAVLRKHEMQVSGSIGPFTPLLLAYWTTSDFEASAKKFSRNIGLWFMDGMTLASYIERLDLSERVFALAKSG